MRLQLWGVAFVLPALLFFVFFKYGPMGWAFWLSFTSYDMLAPPRFVGFANFAGLAGDPVFLQALENTLVYVVASTVLVTVVALLLALAVSTRVPGARVCMSGIFLTNVMPIIAVCLVWRFLLHPTASSTSSWRRSAPAGSIGSPATPPRCQRSSW